jgi:hypothetical protein
MAAVIQSLVSIPTSSGSDGSVEWEGDLARGIAPVKKSHRRLQRKETKTDDNQSLLPSSSPTSSPSSSPTPPTSSMPTSTLTCDDSAVGQKRRRVCYHSLM